MQIPQYTIQGGKTMPTQLPPGPNKFA